MAADTDHSANYYLPGCRDFVNKRFEINPFLQGHCIGVIEGLAMMTYDSPLVQRSCVPDDVTVAQVAAMVVRWFDQRPELWHRDFRASVITALHDASPC
jgi:hypothetical protein